MCLERSERHDCYHAVGNKIKDVDPENYTKALEASDPSVINSLPGILYAYDDLNRLFLTTAFDGVNCTTISYREFDGRSNVIKDASGMGYTGCDFFFCNIDIH